MEKINENDNEGCPHEMLLHVTFIKTYTMKPIL